MNNLYVFLPCYNEGLNIGTLIDEWMDESALLSDKGYKLIICPIDDCSTDNTRQVMLDKVVEYGDCNVKVIIHEQNMNLRGGLNTSIARFLEWGGKNDLMCLMDGDDTHAPKFIHPMVNKINDDKLDCVIASRYCDDSATQGLAGHRKFLSDMAKIYYCLMLRVPGVKDYTCGYRVYTKHIIAKLVELFGEDPVKEKSFACMMELLFKIYLCGATFGEVGFELRYDKKQGESKMNIGNTMRNSLSAALRLRKLKKTIMDGKKNGG